MKRRDFLVLSGTGVIVGAHGAHANTYADAVVAQLQKQGFGKIEIGTTWLGRVRILASRTDGQREVILNPRTGEVLRDTWTAISATGKSQPVIDDVGGGSDGNSGQDPGKTTESASNGTSGNASGGSSGSSGSSGSGSSGSGSGSGGSGSASGSGSGSGSGGSDDGGGSGGGQHSGGEHEKGDGGKND